MAVGGAGCETSPPGPLRTANQGVAEPQPTLRDGSLYPHPPWAPSVPAVHQGLMRSARAAEQGVFRVGGDGRLRHHALSDDGGGAPPTMMPPGGTAVDGACGGCWRALRARGAWGRGDRESTWSSRPPCLGRSPQAVWFKPGPPPLPLLLAVGTGRRTGAARLSSRPL